MELIWDQEHQYDKQASLKSLRLQFSQYVKHVKSTPRHVKEAFYLLISLCKNPRMVLVYGRRLWRYVQNLPIVSFYLYLWREDKMQLFMNLFVSYLLPLILENMPWYLSRRKLGRVLRRERNSIYNSVVRKSFFERALALRYLFSTAWYVLIMSLEMHIKNRVALKDKFLVKRLVLQRLLFSEIDVFSEYGSKELEVRIMYDINRTLRLFSFVIPQIMSNCYAMFAETNELYQNREKLDWIAVMRPLLASSSWTLIDWVKVQVFGEGVTQLFVTKPEVTKLFHNAIEGLVDIQLNNLQEQQLNLYDSMLQEEFSWYESLRYFVNRAYRSFTSRGALDFISTMFVTDLVMRRRDMNYEEYRKMQMDIDHLRNIGRRTFKQLRSVKRVFESQHHVATVLNSPNFHEEEKTLPYEVHDFHKLVMKNIVFSYHFSSGSASALSTIQEGDSDSSSLPHPRPPYALNFTDQLEFSRGRTYGIIGQNRSGKSTLVKLICKLYKPQMGSIIINDLDYRLVKRRSLRNLLSYISQKPYIFPGTIRENILIGNIHATEDEIIEAATAAGIFTFDEMLKQEEEARKIKELIQRAKKSASEASFNQIKDMTQKRIAQLKEKKRSLTEERIAQPKKYVTVHFEERHPLRVSIGPSPRKHSTEGRNRPVALSIKPNKVYQQRGPIRLCIDALVPDGATTATGLDSGKSSEASQDKALSRERKVEILNMRTRERGANVSGGFGQSIALSRVFLNREAKLVILDESMSAMDPIKKRSVIYPALMKFIKKHNMTLLLISHDMSCVDYVDEVILLEAGRIAAQGSHHELKRVRSGPYMQMLGAKF